ncbi:MAG: hypothetical protein C4534_09865, partial [Gaiellales bacterium]
MSKPGFRKIFVAPLIIVTILAFAAFPLYHGHDSLAPYSVDGILPGDGWHSLIHGGEGQEPAYAEGRILLRLNEPLAAGPGGIDPAATGNPEMDMLNTIHGITTVELLAAAGSGPGGLYLYQFSFPEGAPVKDVAAAYEASPVVAYAEPDYEVAAFVEAPDDPYYASSGSWGQAYDDLWGVKKIDSLGAWQVNTGSPGTVVAVVDTGLDFTHPDIQGNIWTNNGETGLDGNGQDKATNGVDDDANGYVDDWRGWDYYNNDNDPTDDHGHGTHVAGTITATTNNGIGVAGVSWQAKIMPLKFLGGSGSGYTSGAVSAIRYAADNGAVISNNSWGGGGWSQTLADAFAYAHGLGMTHVAAAGNSSADCSNYQPAAFPTVITVAATQYNDTRAYFSNYGPKVDVAAPGVDTLSLRAAGTSMGSAVGTYYTRASGTSMATPHVAGLAALIHSEHPGWSNEQIRQVIRSSADDIGEPGRDDYYGYGRIDAAEAMATGEPPVALLTGPIGTVKGAVDITGSAGGNGFTGYVLEYATAAAPADWVELAAGAEPKNNEVIHSGFDTSLVADGTLTFRLTVTSETGQAYEVISPVVDNVYLTAPAAGTLSATPATVTVSGRAVGTGFEGYEVLYGAGEDPVSWSAAGVTLAGGGSSPVEQGTLATWDTSGVTEAGLYTVRLVTHLGGRDESEQASIYLDPDIHGGWPQQIDSDSTIAFMDTPTVADLDGDGSAETLYSYLDQLYVVQADGTPYPGWPRQFTYMSWSQRSPAVGELDGDDALEIIFNDGAYTYAWNDDGTVVAGWPVYIGTYTMPVVTDIEDDGVNEVVIVGIYKSNSGIRIVDADGSLRPGWPVATPASWQGQPAVGDIDGDGLKEIVFAGSYGETYAYNDDGTTVPGWPVVTHSSLNYSYPGMGDLDGDGSMEVVIGSNLKKVYALDGDGTTLSGWPQSTAGYAYSSPAVGDIDNDGAVEIVAGCSMYGGYSTRKLYAWEADGSLMAGWPVTAGSTNHTYYGYGSPALADIDADQVPEIVVENDTRYLNAYENNGSVAAGFPRYTGEIGAFMTNVPAVGDLDGDGLVEVIAANFGKSLIMWDLPAAATAANDWPGFRHDPGHSGTYSRGAGGVSIENSTVTAAATHAAPGEEVAVTVTLRDRYGAPLAGRSVTLAASGGEATLTQPGATTNGSGEAAGAIAAAEGVLVVSASVDGAELLDTATVVFTSDTEAPQVTVLAPAGGELWRGDTEYEVRWQASDDAGMSVSPISIEYSADGGSSWTTVASGEADDGSYLWTTPTIDSSTVLVRVKALDSSLREGSGTSQAVTIDSTVPALESKSPQAGATYVSPDSVVTARFSESVDPATVDGASVTLRHADGEQYLDAAVSYDAGARTVTLTPAMALEEGTRFEARVGSEIRDLAGNQLTTATWTFTTAAAGGRSYYFTWYDSRRANGMNGDWIVVANKGSETASVDILVAGELKGSWAIAPEEEITPQFPETMGGPVEVVSTNNQPLMVSQRVIYKDSFNEIFAVPATALDSTYYFTWYDSLRENMMRGNWILITNMGETDSLTDIYVAGEHKGRYSVAPGQQITPQFTGSIGGPVKVESVNGQPLLVSQRVIYRDSFNEVMGVPASRVDDTYYFTWYDSKRANGMYGNWVLAANLGAETALVEVYIGGEYRGGFELPPGGMAAPVFPETMGGPVKVVSTNGQPLIVSQRTLYRQSFEEVQGTPPAGLGTDFGFTWYDARRGSGMYGSWLLIGNHGGSQADVSIYIAGQKMDDS